MFEDVVNSISRERDKIRYPDKTGGCLVKRTLVHTREGLRPIEQIKIGDYVLSSPEDGSGGAEYKRVVKTFVHTNRVIAAFLWWGAEDGGIYRVAGTPNHPFWVEGVGWTRGDCLNPDDEIRSINGGAVEVNRCQQIYRTKLPGVGWRSALSRDDEGAWGGCFNYEECMQFDDPTEQYLYLDPEIENSENPYLAVTVYNIEVEDFHTYYVHPHGVWVHNTNCDERIELSNGDGVLPEPDRLF
ncbi:MAG: hypothetical protein JNJ60_22005 [Rhodocyclaceae bacterium]|nr:hypothetical protein [Rhodocyclaceae bacterium]